MICDLCKRELKPTTHTKDGYVVEAYRLHTGVAVPVTIADENDEEIKYNKLESQHDVTMCAPCLAKPDVIRSVEKFEDPR